MCLRLCLRADTGESGTCMRFFHVGKSIVGIDLQKKIDSFTRIYELAKVSPILCSIGTGRQFRWRFPLACFFRWFCRKTQGGSGWFVELPLSYDCPQFDRGSTEVHLLFPV